ncbi:MAG: two pore domain potassium channel family protein [Lachnospiraceae bacterium]|nr:two pore domain potassium channel family protein [Lachnospiraceae bacterium]
MDNQRKKISKTFLRVLETLIDIVALAFSLQLLVNTYLTYDNIFYTIFILALCSYVLSAVNTGSANKLPFIRNIVIAGIYFITILVMIILKESGYAVTAIFIIYFVSAIFTRIISIIRKRKIWNILLNILLIILWLGLIVLAASPYWNDAISAMILGICIPIQMLIRVTILSFSRIRYDILSKVIKKSMAWEILSGLMILIVSFSFALTAIEESIETYPDALWYCFAIVTTIGFGDITAVSTLGRILSVILGLYGIIVVSLITSIIVNFYTEINKDESKDNKSDGT